VFSRENLRLRRRQAFSGDRLHQATESIELVERGVNIRRDANAFELLVKDRGREYAMLVEEVSADSIGINPLDIDVRNRT